jgi:nucleoside-diphosphate kinase
MERTLVLLKPDAVQRGLTGEIISRFEQAGLKLVATKMVRPEKELAHKHYPTGRRQWVEGMGKKSLHDYQEQGIDPVSHIGTNEAHKIGLMVQGWLVDFLVSGPVIALVLEGQNAIQRVRDIAGNTVPIYADKGTIRGDFSDDSPAIANKEKRAVSNLVHASGDKEEAAFEIGLWFSEEELHDYEAQPQNLTATDVCSC